MLKEQSPFGYLDNISLDELRQQVQEWPYSLKVAGFKVANTAEEDLPALWDTAKAKFENLRKQEVDWWNLEYYRDVMWLTALSPTILETIKASIPFKEIAPSNERKRKYTPVYTSVDHYSMQSDLVEE